MDTGERAEPAAAATCVVWRPRDDAPPPQPLVQALAVRGVRAIHCSDAYDAFARLCQSAGSDDPGDHSGSIILVDRARLKAVDDLLEAVETYIPAIAPWSYDDQAGLRPLTHQPQPRPQSETDTSPSRNPPNSAGPHLRLIGQPAQDDIQSSDDADDDEQDPTTSQMLTDEELTMLLGEDLPGNDEPEAQP